MVERALHGEIEGNLQLVAPGCGHQALEIFQSSELGVNRYMAAGGRTYRIDTTGIVGRGL
jgi:hypothetical protein